MNIADETTGVAIVGRTIPVEIFQPAGAPPHPAVVVLPELFGVNDDIRRIARRFADNGYVAAAADFLAGGWRIPCIAQAIRDLNAGSGPVVAALEDVIGMLEGRPDVGKVGVVGFCMGGGFALLLGCRGRPSVAGVYYGETRPRAELVNACPVMGGFGALDRTFAGKGRRLIADLDAVGKEHDVRMYEDAGHSFMNDSGHPLLATLTRPLLHVEYNATAAEDSWRRMLAFFGRHLEPEARPAAS
jgi:carboxymethylenebutenolidase